MPRFRIVHAGLIPTQALESSFRNMVPENRIGHQATCHTACIAHEVIAILLCALREKSIDFRSSLGDPRDFGNLFPDFSPQRLDAPGTNPGFEITLPLFFKQLRREGPTLLEGGASQV